MDVKKIFNILNRVLVTLLIIFTTFMMVFTIISVTTFDRNDRSLLGYKFYIVTSDSMSPSENNKDLDIHFSAGDMIIVKEVDDHTGFKSGDVITFISTNDDSWGETITHMIREPKYKSDGSLLGYVTFGTNTGTNDANLVGPGDIVGQYKAKIPSVGKFFAFVKSTPGYICCILVPFLLLILSNGVDVIRLFRKYKKEQTAILDAEKAEIAAERQRNEDMLLELQKLKEQLASGIIPAEALRSDKTPTPDEAPVASEPVIDEAAEETTVEEKASTEEELAAQKKAEAARKRRETLARKKAEAEAEATRVAAEEEAQRLAEEEAARKKAEAARKRKETLARKKAEAEAEAARVAAEEEAQRLAEEEAARKKAEAARKRKETIARKKAEAEAEAARIAAENEASDEGTNT